MLRQYLVGALASVCNIAIHALVMVSVIKVARTADELATSYQTFRLIAVMSATVTVLMIAHLAEVMVWSLTYAIFSVAPEGADMSSILRLCAQTTQRLVMARRDAGRALAFPWAHDRDERCAVVRLVDRRGFRGVEDDASGGRRRHDAWLAEVARTHNT